jgi:hypothetical protein
MMDRAELVSSVEAGGREMRGGGEEAVETGKACGAPENARWGRGTRIMQRPLQKPLERVHDRFSSNFEDAAMEAEAAGDIRANVVTVNELVMTVLKPATFPEAMLCALSSKNTCHGCTKRTFFMMVTMDRRDMEEKLVLLHLHDQLPFFDYVRDLFI